MAFRNFSRRDFMTAAATAAGSALVPKLLSASPFQDPVVDTIKKDGKTVSREKVPWKVQPFPLQASPPR